MSEDVGGLDDLHPYAEARHHYVMSSLGRRGRETAAATSGRSLAVADWHFYKHRKLIFRRLRRRC